jgi:murein DD-endopeptidase MepM/ murein hydrolase activator NlpD
LSRRVFVKSDDTLNGAVRSRVRSWFPERELFLRSNGAVRFVRLSTALQLRIVAIVLLVAIVWGGATLFLLAHRAQVAVAGARVAREQASVDRRASKVEAYRRSAAGIARDLEQRQHAIENLVRSRVGPIAAPPVPGPVRTGAALPDAAQLHTLEQRQSGLARALASAFDAKTARNEAMLRRLGLNPRAILKASREEAGGPLMGWPLKGETRDPALRRLAASVERFGLIEDNLVSLPSGMPVAAQMVSSSYGVRRDPFTGGAAFHPGLDFVGRYGQPIAAAADGKVAFVGDRSGYGHVVEIDHGHGIMTRYAHLSGFNTQVGTAVRRGEQIARMGSTGRSTGTHLHFEVRYNGDAMNPRRFLEARQDILDAQRTVALRAAPAARRG